MVYAGLAAATRPLTREETQNIAENYLLCPLN